MLYFIGLVVVFAFVGIIGDRFGAWIVDRFVRVVLIGILAMALADMMGPAKAGQGKEVPAGPPMMDPMSGAKFTKDEQDLLDKIDSIESQYAAGKIDGPTASKLINPLRWEFLRKAQRFGPDAPRAETR